MKNVLALALGDLNRIQERYGGPGIEIVDEHPPSKNTYDMVIMDHVLQLAPRVQVPKLVQVYKDALKVGGDMIIIVPSLEWAAVQISTMDDPPVAAYLSIYGDSNEQYLSGMTLYWLRMIAESAGLHVKQATGEWYLAKIGDKETKIMQNLVIATKVPEDKAEAIA